MKRLNNHDSLTENKERSIVKDSILVIIIVIIGKVFGFARELVVAYLYGSSNITDAFYFSNGLLSSVFLIITMGLAQAFTPTYLDIKIQQGDHQARHFSNKLLTVLISVSILVALAMFCFPQVIIRFLAPEMNPETKELCFVMLKILAFCIPFYVVFSIRKCILNSNKKYLVTEASGIPYSISIVLFTILLSRITSANALAYAAAMGVILQYLFTLFFSARYYLFRPARIKFPDSEIKGYFLLLVPIILSALFDEANGILRKSLASGMGEGAVANLNYCMALTTIINGIVITSISTVFYPQIIRDYSEKNYTRYQKDAQKCIIVMLVMVIPLVGFLMMSSTEVVRAIYERGKFTAENTIAVSDIFRVYVIGSIMYAVRYAYRVFFYSVKDTKRPVQNEIIFLALTMLFNVIQVKVLKMGLVSLGYGWLLAMTITTPVLVAVYKKRYYNLFDRGSLIEIGKSFISTCAFVVVHIVIQPYLRMGNQYVSIIISFILSFIIYMAMMILTQSTMFKQLLKGRIRNK